MNMQAATAALNASEAAAAWARAYMKSHRDTWQRSDAKQGLVGSAILALGTDKTVRVVENKSRGEARLAVLTEAGLLCSVLIIDLAA